MLMFLKALLHFLCHPNDTLELTVVRRYADAQRHFIGELYEGTDRNSKMIGASCDNWPLNADVQPLLDRPSICYRESFLAPLPDSTLRVGAFEPKDNARVQEYISKYRYNKIQVKVLNRFCEFVLEGKAKC